MRRKKLVCAVLSALFVFCVPAIHEAGAGEATASRPSLEWFEEKGLTLGESSVTYPALREGTEADAFREKINDQILEDGRVRDYVTRVSQLISGGKLNVIWRGAVMGPVFSFAFDASGAVETLRNTHVWTAGNIDLRDGHEVILEEIWQDPETAREEIEAWLEEEIAPDLSAHLANSGLTPIPELFRMTEQGIILMYPMDQLSTLSDRAGDVLIPWNVMKDQLKTDPEDILTAMGIQEWIGASADDPIAVSSLQKATEDGTIPGIPVRLGARMQELTDQWHLLIDPDVYAGGRMFSLEGACFQKIFLMTDFLSESWENSVVDGIQMNEGSLYGLVIGETKRETWQYALGEPDHTIDFDGERAEAYRTVPGTRDYYEFGEHRLQLHADEEGILRSIILAK